MCGRMFQTLPLHRLLAIARATKATNSEDYNTSYNICPTTYIPAIRSNRRFKAEQSIRPEPVYYPYQPYHEEEKQPEGVDPDRYLTFMKWGHQASHNFIINARAYELLGKRTFLNMINNRCVVVMEGYFEWKEKSEPYMFKPKNSDHFLVAALYSNDNEVILLTKDATKELEGVHDRMPVILSDYDVEVWLNPDNTKEISSIIRNSLLKKDKEVWKNIGFTRLAPHVNSIKEKSKKCIMTYEEFRKEQDRTGIMRFFKKPQPVEVVVNEKAETIEVAPTASPGYVCNPKPSKRDLLDESNSKEAQYSKPSYSDSDQNRLRY